MLKDLRPLGWTLIALAILIPVSGLGAQRTGQTTQTIEIDHRTDRATLVVRQGGEEIRRTPIEPEGEMRLGGNRRALIQITGSNSALYQCAVTQTRTTVPEVEQLRGFLSAFGPYGLEIGTILRLNAYTDTVETATGVDAVETAREAVAAELGRLNFAATAMNDVRARTFLSLEAMRDTTVRVETIATALRSDLECANGGCARLGFLDDVLGALQRLVPATATLNTLLAGRPQATELQKQTAKDAGAVLERADAVVAAAYSTVRLAELASTARASIDCDEVEVAWDRGRDLVVAVTPRKLPETERVTSLPPLEFKAKALPRFRVAPAVGIALLYAPGASYPKFGTVKAAGDSAEIIESGTQNSRITYGLSLGARFQGVGTERLSLHFPELTINPSNDVRAIGLGGALSYGVLKIGGGALWTRHAALDGQEVGTRLRDAAFLRTRDRYDPLDRPNWYVSFSVVGWPPFLNTK